MQIFLQVLSGYSGMAESSPWRVKISSYIRDVWNILDMTAIVLFLIGLIVRLIPHEQCADCLGHARVMFALCLMSFYLRTLHICSIHKVLGPKLVMIREMVRAFIYHYTVP